ncbi:MAG: hypothetical protein JWL98_8 [Xanthomonadaceae bacterium]|nr:hypothetical protein [Xanthomonadaceae bacterium]
MVASLTPPLTSLDALLPQMQARGFAVLSAASVATMAGCEDAALHAMTPGWNDLAPDRYLRDGGHYRKRRHSCFVVDGDAVAQAPHRAHWQSQEYNALHGGMRRWFEPIEPSLIAQAAWSQLIASLGKVFSRLQPTPTWYVEAHQFRIDTTDGVGRPTPEGAHRDGVDFVAVFVVDRVGITGGETRVFEADGPDGQRFTLSEPWSVLLLDDARVIHESTPIQPLQDGAHRDTLVLTYRAGGFQGD